MTTFGDVVKLYDLPARDPSQGRPEMRALSLPRAAAARWLSMCKRTVDRRRLAYLDSTFPWERSGFRYHEALALYELRPDTLFFSLWEMADQFPAQVHPLADFAKIASRAGVTDAYAVFQLFLEGLAGIQSAFAEPHPMEGPDISRLLRRMGIRLHGSIYPGGGFTNNPYGIERARQLAGRLTTTFSYVPEVLSSVPEVTQVPQAFTETRFYGQTTERWHTNGPITCLFAADRPLRKGIEATVGAFRELSSLDFHLHVVGPHEDRGSELPGDLATFHGWLRPSELRDLHRRVHVFVSPVSIEPPGPDGSLEGVVDGFPTQAAADAMSSGCLLVSANPARDYRVLRAGHDYIECEADAESVRLALTTIAANRNLMQRVARMGSDKVRQRMNVRYGAACKLAHMGLRVRPGWDDAQ